MQCQHNDHDDHDHDDYDDDNYEEDDDGDDDVELGCNVHNDFSATPHSTLSALLFSTVHCCSLHCISMQLCTL